MAESTSPRPYLTVFHAALLRALFTPRQRPEDLVLLCLAHKLLHDSHSLGDFPGWILGTAASGNVGGEGDVQRNPFPGI